MKKYLSMALTAAIILSLTACSLEKGADSPQESEKMSVINEAERTAAPQETAAEEAFDLSAYDYGDAELGIVCQLGSGWTKADAMALESINQSLEHDLKSAAEEAGTFAHSIECKLVASQTERTFDDYMAALSELPGILGAWGRLLAPETDDENEPNRVSVFTEDLASTNAIALTEEAYITVYIGDDESILATLGIENGTVEHTEAEIAGQTHAALVISGTIDGEAYHRLQIVCKPRKLYRYITMFIVECYGEDSTTDIVQNIFSAIE